MMQRLLIAAVRGYRFWLSPWLGPVCRFDPGCSCYALQALTQHGAAAGSCLTLCRLLRCHPWCDGGHDPVPQTLPRSLRLFSRLAPAHAQPSPAYTQPSPARTQPSSAKKSS